MKLSKFIAQKIVKEMMQVIPYNINVMDENGVIIGSGDIKRIGEIHEGAREAIESRVINEVYNPKEGMKPGVNEPIIMNEKVIGVVGITGYPDDVRRFSKLVRVTAVLLIEQSINNEMLQNKRLNMQKFYQELAHRKTEYDEEFYERAKNYGLDLTKKCQAMLIEGKVNSKDFRRVCQAYSHYFDLENNKTVFFIIGNQPYKTMLDNLKEIEGINKIILGGQEDIAAVSLENAELVMKVGTRVKPSSKVYRYDDLKFFIHLSYENKEELISLFSNLDKSGNKLELIQTLQVYVEENGDINSASNKLNIHRNTLNYRLERIHQLTGKNPKVLLELFELLYGLIWR